MLTAEAHSNRKCCLSLHYGKGNCFLFINAKQECHFKAKDFEKKSLVFRKCFQNFFFFNNMKKSVSNESVYNISVDFSFFDTSISITMGTSLKNIM